MKINNIEYSTIKLLGKGKGGYSYLVKDPKNNLFVIKQIHHEPCDYYQFGNKLEAEIHDYEKLSRIGITMPKMLNIDYENERILKEYIDGISIFECVLNNQMKEEYLDQIKKMCERLYAAHTNIDYFPTNFIVQNGELYYKWNFENWGIKYWSKTPEFIEYLKQNK